MSSYHQPTGQKAFKSKFQEGFDEDVAFDEWMTEQDIWQAKSDARTECYLKKHRKEQRKLHAPKPIVPYLPTETLKSKWSPTTAGSPSPRSPRGPKTPKTARKLQKTDPNSDSPTVVRSHKRRSSLRNSISKIADAVSDFFGGSRRNSASSHNTVSKQPLISKKPAKEDSSARRHSHQPLGTKSQERKEFDVYQREHQKYLKAVYRADDGPNITKYKARVTAMKMIPLKANAKAMPMPENMIKADANFTYPRRSAPLRTAAPVTPWNPLEPATPPPNPILRRAVPRYTAEEVLKMKNKKLPKLPGQKSKYSFESDSSANSSSSSSKSSSKKSDKSSPRATLGASFTEGINGLPSFHRTAADFPAPLFSNNTPGKPVVGLLASPRPVRRGTTIDMLPPLPQQLARSNAQRVSPHPHYKQKGAVQVKPAAHPDWEWI